MTHSPTHVLSMTVLMTPDMANFAGNVHGGTLLKFLDQVAYACASRYAARYVVTVSVDQVMFRQPVHVGELVTFMASVNYTGKSSMEIGIKVIAENIRSQQKRHVNSCFFTMVAVDDDRRPVDPGAERGRRPRGEVRIRVGRRVAPGVDEPDQAGLGHVRGEAVEVVLERVRHPRAGG